MNNAVHATGSPRVQALPQEAPLRDHLKFGEPEGATDRIAITSKWLERDGQPWFPITGEVHYSRIPRDRWKEVVAKTAAGGLNSVAAYVFWNVHEPRQGQFRWDGNRDLRAFIQICAAQGLDVIVRMGPWSHGESRNGGFPDWVLNLDIETRTNSDEYLKLVRELYREIADQMRGLTHAEGGPIVGVQLENELYEDSQHLATLRVIAEEELGIDVPLWTATGWGGAQVPETLFPLYSAYAEGFWEESNVEWPPFSAYHFRYSEVRDDLNVGKDLREALDGIVRDPDFIPLKDDTIIPFATCELGGGMHVAYHRRPLVTSDDVTNLALAKIGSGSIWQGYYMYSGGTLPLDIDGTTLQESHETGYPNDVPTRTYDFYAPLGEHAQVRPHYHQLRLQHLALELDGHNLAAMRSVIGGGSEDPHELRWAVRSNGQRGYVYFTTYQPAKSPINAQPGVQVDIEIGNETLTVPTQPVDLPQGVSVAWPLNYPLSSGLTLRSATAQLVTKISDEAGEIYVLVATPSIPVEVVLAGEHEVSGPVTAVRGNRQTVLTLTAEPSLNTVLEVEGTRLLVVDETSARSIYRLKFAGRERLISASAPIYLVDGNLVVHPENVDTTISMLPAPADLSAASGHALAQATTGMWTTWTLTAPEAESHRIVENLAPQAEQDPEPQYGGPLNRLKAPTDFTQAAHVPIEVPAQAITGIDRAIMRIDWTGDVGRAEIGGEIVADHFWYGRTWDIDLTPHAQQVEETGVTLHLMPWKRETGVWVDPEVRDIPDGISVKSVDIIRIPRITLTAQQ